MPTKIKLQLQRSVDGEWRVAYYQDGKFLDGPTYYADSLEDAKGTRDAMAREATKQGHLLHLPRAPRRGMRF